MSFPMDQFDILQRDARAIIQDRCEKGRNATMPFYDRYLHGYKDKVQEVWERALRIAGADQVNDLPTMRADAIDLANEALLLVLLLDRQLVPAQRPADMDTQKRDSDSQGQPEHGMSDFHL